MPNTYMKVYGRVGMLCRKQQEDDTVEQQEILAMKAGRDLDIKAALTVMDYIWLKHLLQFSAELAVKWLGTAADIAASGGVYVEVKPEQFRELKEREDFAAAVLPFSTDLAAAEQVAERMREKGYQYTVAASAAQGQTVYTAQFSADGQALQPVTATTQPEAIVKAALLALS